jgi:cytochrome c biogenesis factor
MVGLIGCHLYQLLDLRKYAVSIFGALVIGFICIIVEFPTSNILANLGIPIVLMAGLAVTHNFAISIVRKNITQVSRSLMHFGIILILLGILISSTNEINYGKLKVRTGSTIDLGRMELSFGEFFSIEPTGLVVSDVLTNELIPEYTGFFIPITVTRDGLSYTKDVFILLYSLHGIVSRPTVIRAPGYDVYLVLDQTSSIYRALSHQLQGIPFVPNEFIVSVLYFPFMNLIWLGTILLCIGVLYPITKIRK